MARYLHEPSLSSSDETSEGATLEDSFPEELYGLGEFLTLSTWENGQSRLTGSCTFFVEEGMLKCCLSDKATKKVCFVSGGNWRGLLSAMERGLREGSLEWRRTREFGRKSTTSRS